MSNNEIRDTRGALIQRRRELLDELENVDQEIAALDNVPGSTPRADRAKSEGRNELGELFDSYGRGRLHDEEPDENETAT